MELEHRVEGPILVATPLEQRLDARSAPSFRDRIIDFVKAGHQRIVLDLSRVEFIDSSGIGAIVSVRKQLADQGELVICGASPTVASMFKLTRLDKVFQIVLTQEDALASLNQ